MAGTILNIYRLQDGDDVLMQKLRFTASRPVGGIVVL